MPNNANRKAGDRSRIDGTLHRYLPAQIQILRAMPGEGGDGPAGETPMEEGQEPLMLLRLTVSSEEPYLRESWWDDPWIEVLGHKTGEVDLNRLQGGAPVLANHDRWTAVGNTPLAGIGAVQTATLEATRLVCDIAISRREGLEDLRQDITDGLVRNVSIGYLINERVLVKANGDGQADEYRVTSWTPFEISLVDIPADPTVGLGRSADLDRNKTPAPQYRVVDLPAPGQTQGDRSMPTPTPADNPTATPTPAPAPTPAARGTDPLELERARVREITAIGREFRMAEQADQAIENGQSVDAFRAAAINHIRDTGALRQAESTEIGMSRREIESFSFCRALLAAADPLNAAKLAPFELECSRAAQDKRGDSRDKTREAAVTIPFDVLARGMNIGADVAQAVARQLIQRAQASSRETLRDLNVGAATAGGNLVATELVGSSFIELLRNAMVLDSLGVTWLRDLNGNLVIPSQTGAATGYWVAESGAPTESEQTVGQVTMSPKTVGAFTDYSRRLLLQSSIDVEAFVRADLASVIGQSIQHAAINGATNGPTGLLNTSGIGSVAGGTDGAAPTYEHAVDLETALANANADASRLAYLTNTKVRGKLRKTQEFATTNGKPVWTTMPGLPGVGEVLGYSALTTNAVPANLDKGTSTGVCSALIFANWADMLIGMWGGLDVLLDPYAGATSGTRRVVALQDVDVQLRRAVSFAAMTDALTQ